MWAYNGVTVHKEKKDTFWFERGSWIPVIDFHKVKTKGMKLHTHLEMLQEPKLKLM